MQNAPREHSAILLTFIKLPFVFKTFVLSIFEWPLKTGFTVHPDQLDGKTDEKAKRLSVALYTVDRDQYHLSQYLKVLYLYLVPI